MSGFIGAAVTSQIIQREDKRALAERYRQDEEIRHGDTDFTSPWWPGGGLLGEQGIDVAVLDSSMNWYEWPDTTRGMNSRLGIIGISRDVFNSPVGGVTVKCFVAGTDEKVSEVVSDPLGNYLCSSPYPSPTMHYVVSFGAGVQGVTAPILIAV